MLCTSSQFGLMVIMAIERIVSPKKKYRKSHVFRSFWTLIASTSGWDIYAGCRTRFFIYTPCHSFTNRHGEAPPIFFMIRNAPWQVSWQIGQALTALTAKGRSYLTFLGLVFISTANFRERLVCCFSHRKKMTSKFE